MNRLRWLMCKLFGHVAVILHDFDGEMNVRLVRQWPYGKPHCARHGLGVRTVFLEDDHKVTGAPYVVRWEPLNW